MFVTSKVVTKHSNLVGVLLNALSTRPAAALLATPTVHLYTAGPSPIPDVWAAADFTEAAFGGYSAQLLTLSSANLNLPNGNGLGKIGDVLFAGSGVVPPGEVILGYWIDDGATSQYVAEEFQAPINIAADGDFINLEVVFPEEQITDVE